MPSDSGSSEAANRLRRPALLLLLAGAAILLFAISGLRRLPKSSAGSSAPRVLEVEKPSPIAPMKSAEVSAPPHADTKIPPTLPPVKESTRRETDLSGNADWSVVAAIYRNYEAASLRAEAFRRQWTPSHATVFPEEGQSDKYMVVIGSRLTRQDAEKVLEAAKAAGLPADSYITKLRSPEQ